MWIWEFGKKLVYDTSDSNIGIVSKFRIFVCG